MDDFGKRCDKITGFKVKGKVHTSQRPKWPELIRVSYEALGVLLIPRRWDVSPSQGYPPVVCRQCPFIHLREERQNGVKLLV